MYSLGAGYKLSKRTEVYGLFARLNNKRNATHEYGVNTLSGVTAGADSTGFGVGIQHSF